MGVISTCVLHTLRTEFLTNWTATNPTSGDIGATHFNVVYGKAEFAGRAVIIQLESRNPDDPMIGPSGPVKMVDKIRVLCCSQESMEVWRMAKEVRRILKAAKLAPPDNIRQINLLKSNRLYREVSEPDKETLVEEVRVLLSYQES